MSFWKEVGKAAIHGLVGAAVVEPGNTIGKHVANVIERVLNPRKLPTPRTRRRK